jgi:hypothetical protein
MYPQRDQKSPILLICCPVVGVTIKSEYYRALRAWYG